MLSPLRNRFGIPGVISVIALVFAMLGGAYAASNNGGRGKATASAKGKPGPRGPRGKTGSAGPAGPAGVQGSAGAKGDTGAKGDKGDAGNPGAPGSPGAAGKSVAITEVEPGFEGPLEECEERGGTVVELEDEPSSATEVCNGKEGSPWTDGGTLPPGALETGAFSFHGTAAENPSVGAAISFPIPLAQELSRSHIHILFADPEEEFNAACAEGTYAGTFARPNAAPGEMCIWPADLIEAEIDSIAAITFGPNELESVGPTGGFLYANMTGTGRGTGTFAVRGCAGSTGTKACP